MLSLVADNRDNEYMSFKHVGMIKDGVDDIESDKLKKWAGAFENYTLYQTDGTTNLKVEMDTTHDHKELFWEDLA